MLIIIVLQRKVTWSPIIVVLKNFWTKTSLNFFLVLCKHQSMEFFNVIYMYKYFFILHVNKEVVNFLSKSTSTWHLEQKSYKMNDQIIIILQVSSYI